MPMTEEFWNSLEWLSDVLFCGCYEAFLYQRRNSVGLNNKPIFKGELFSDLLQYSLVLEEWHVYIFCENVLEVVENQINQSGICANFGTNQSIHQSHYFSVFSCFTLIDIFQLNQDIIRRQILVVFACMQSFRMQYDKIKKLHDHFLNHAKEVKAVHLPVLFFYVSTKAIRSCYTLRMNILLYVLLERIITMYSIRKWFIICIRTAKGRLSASSNEKCFLFSCLLTYLVS